MPSKGFFARVDRSGRLPAAAPGARLGLIEELAEKMKLGSRKYDLVEV